MTLAGEQSSDPSTLRPRSQALKVLLTSYGSRGDLHPFIGIASALRRRGHEVALIANAHFEPLARDAGIGFISSGTEQEYRALLEDPDLWSGPKGGRVLVERGVGPIIPRVYRAIESHYQPGRTVVLASPWSFGARIAQDKLGVPVATCALSPQTMMSAHDPGPGFPPGATLEQRQAMLFQAEHNLLDPLLCPPINRFRHEVALPPVERIQTRWLPAPDRVMCLWPDWFSPPQPDWPAQARTCGFVLYDGAGDLPSEVREFLDGGEAPVAFVTSTGMVDTSAFLTESVAACRQLGCRGLLLGGGEDRSLTFPASVMRITYAPFGPLLRRCRAVVHHATIGTVAFSLAAGLVQIAVPRGNDQRDNAMRLERLGTSRTISPGEYRADRVSRDLSELLGSGDARRRAAELAASIQRAHPMESICRWTEDLGGLSHGGDGEAQT